MSMAHTPGPWRFEAHPRFHSIQLSGGKPMYDKTVMGFQRWGMGGAAPVFRGSDNFLLKKIDPLLVPCPGREHHDWYKLIDHPDARLIEAAPDLLETLKEATVALLVAVKAGVDFPGFDPEEHRVLRKCRAAIAKAEGK